MSTQPLLLFGAGTVAKLLIEFIAEDSRYSVAAIVVDDEYIDNKNNKLANKPIVGFTEAQKLFDKRRYKVINTIGYAEMRKRQATFEKLSLAGFNFESFVSKNALISKSATIGDGCIVFPNVTIEPGCSIGSNNLLWSSVTVCHDTNIGDHNFIAAGSVIGGGVTIGNLCFFGFNSVVLQHVRVASETLLGANSLLIENSLSGFTYTGSPAQQARNHTRSGICIK